MRAGKSGEDSVNDYTLVASEGKRRLQREQKPGREVIYQNVPFGRRRSTAAGTNAGHLIRSRAFLGFRTAPREAPTRGAERAQPSKIANRYCTRLAQWRYREGTNGVPACPRDAGVRRSMHCSCTDYTFRDELFAPASKGTRNSLLYCQILKAKYHQILQQQTQ